MNTMAARAVILSAAMMLGAGAYAADKISPDKKDVRPDAAFVTEAAQDGHAEVELGKLAALKGDKSTPNTRSTWSGTTKTR